MNGLPDAAKGEDIMAKEIIKTDQAPSPAGPYSQGVRWEGLVFTAGQVGVDPSTGKPVVGGVQEQTRQVLKNVQAVLEAGGSSLDNVVKTTCFLADIDDFAAFNEVYQEFFPDARPARSTVEVGLPSPWRVEVEAVGIRS
jgi:2-iminobutanoate/2-iminopropanoate deaminase